MLRPRRHVACLMKAAGRHIPANGFTVKRDSPNPFSREKRSTWARGPAMAPEPLSSRRVLIANPDQAEQRHLSSVVTSLGFEPVLVGSGHESWTTLSRQGFL